MSWWVSRDFYCLAYRFGKLMSHVKKVLRSSQDLYWVLWNPIRLHAAGAQAWQHRIVMCTIHRHSSISKRSSLRIEPCPWMVYMHRHPLLHAWAPVAQCHHTPSVINSCCLLSILSDSDQIHIQNSIWLTQVRVLAGSLSLVRTCTTTWVLTLKFGSLKEAEMVQTVVTVCGCSFQITTSDWICLFNLIHWLQEYC